MVNAWEFAKLTRQAAELGRYVIAVCLFFAETSVPLSTSIQAGDFNSVPTTLPMTIIRDHASLSDSWAVTHPNSDILPSNAIPPPHETIKRFGVTADSPLNSYSAGKPLDPYARKFWGKRLDYVFYRQPVRYTETLIPRLDCVECRVVLTEKVPGATFSFSDHFGLESILQIQNIDAVPATANVSEGYVPSTELSNATISTTIQALAACYRFSRYRARRELYVFGLCLFILAGLTIGSSWLPHAWINPIFIIFTIFIAWLATTMLYSGFLYGQWECNALTNVVEELEIFKTGLEMQRRSQSLSTSANST